MRAKKRTLSVASGPSCAEGQNEYKFSSGENVNYNNGEFSHKSASGRHSGAETDGFNHTLVGQPVESFDFYSMETNLKVK